MLCDNSAKSDSQIETSQVRKKKTDGHKDKHEREHVIQHISVPAPAVQYISVGSLSKPEGSGEWEYSPKVLTPSPLQQRMHSSIVISFH